MVGRLLYIDNFAVAAVSEEEADRALIEMEAALGSAGVVSHRDPVGADGRATLLGFELDDSKQLWRPTRKKFWRTKFALDHFLRQGHLVTGAEVECLLGHLTAIFLVRRELLSIFCHLHFCVAELHKAPAAVAIGAP